MKVYSIQETDYENLEESLECIMEKAKKLLTKMTSGEFGTRKRSRNDWEDEEDDYDWKIKKGRYSRY